jgi:hypothetical protein
MSAEVVGLEPTTLILKTKVLPIKLYLPGGYTLNSTFISFLYFPFLFYLGFSLLLLLFIFLMI